MGLMLAKFSLNVVKIAPVHLMVELCHPTLRVAVTMAVKHSANVVKDGVVPFSGLKALMQTQARALLNAQNNTSVLVNVDEQWYPTHTSVLVNVDEQWYPTLLCGFEI